MSQNQSKSNLTISGQCLCGEVMFEVSGKLPGLYQCHCSLCRKVSGSSSNSATFVDKQNFTWVKGQNHISRYKTTTGFRSDFCRHCGCTLPNELGNRKAMWVPVGLLENTDEFKVVAHLYVDSKAHWDTIGGDATQHATMPEFAALDSILREG